MNRVFGMLLVTTGVLVMGLSGLCSGFILTDGFQHFNVNALPAVAIVGGLSLVVGYALYRGGRTQLGGKRDKPGSRPPPN